MQRRDDLDSIMDEMDCLSGGPTLIPASRPVEFADLAAGGRPLGCASPGGSGGYGDGGFSGEPDDAPEEWWRGAARDHPGLHLAPPSLAVELARSVANPAFHRRIWEPMVESITPTSIVLLASSAHPPITLSTTPLSRHAALIAFRASARELCANRASRFNGAGEAVAREVTPWPFIADSPNVDLSVNCEGALGGPMSPTGAGLRDRRMARRQTPHRGGL